jgi:hypothetical protein
MLRHAFLPVALLAAAPLAAQDFQSFCNGTVPVRVGAWASYQFTGGRADGSTMRMAIVGSERFGDSTYYWYELQTTAAVNKKPNHMIMQILMAGIASPKVALRGLIMKNNNEAAMRAPDMMVGMMGRSVTGGVSQYLEQQCKKGGIQVLGVESVTVPAGSFQALHVKDNDGGEAWLQPRAGVFPMVKVLSKDGTVMVLTGRGDDAKSAITETPQPMMR